LLLIFILFFNINYLSAQQNPPCISWKSIDTGTYEIIFPEEITPLGQRVANLMVHFEKYNYLDIKTKPRQILILSDMLESRIRRCKSAWTSFTANTPHTSITIMRDWWTSEADGIRGQVQLMKRFG